MRWTGSRRDVNKQRKPKCQSGEWNMSGVDVGKEARMSQKDDALDRTVAEIQEAILDDARKVYSERVIDHFLHPRNVGGIEDADGFAKVTGPCGDTMYLSLKVKGGTIVDARFMTDGCATTIACGSITTELVRGKSVEDAMKISSSEILGALDGLPEASEHCSVLAANTLHRAIGNYWLSKETGGGREDKSFDA